MSADKDKMSTKEFLASRWKAHRDAYRAGSFELDDGSFGFIAVDRAIQPPAFFMATMQPDGRLKAQRGDLPDDNHGRMELGRIALVVASGGLPSKEVPVGEALGQMGLVGEGLPLADVSVRRFAQGLAQPSLVARLPLADLTKAEAKRLEEAGIGRIRALLDPEALKALGASENFLWRDYLYYAEQGERGTVRRQAAELFPLLATMMVARPSLKLAVDRKSSLVDALVAAFGNGPDGKARMSKGIVGRLRNIPWRTGGIKPDKMAFALAEIPPDWFPKDKDEWEAFCDITDTVGKVLRDATGIGVEALYAGCGGKWVEFRERLARSYTDGRPPAGTVPEDEGILKAIVRHKELEKLPRHKVAAAAEEAAARFAQLPGAVRLGYCTPGADPGEAAAARSWVEGVLGPKVASMSAEEMAALADQLDGLASRVAPYEIADWVNKLYAPDLSRGALRNACICAEDMLNAMAKKVILPLAASHSGLADVYLAQLHIDEAKAAAAQVLFSGKSAANIFDLSRHFHSQLANIMAAGADEVDDEERRRREEEQRRTAALHALGIDSAMIPDDGWPPLCPITQAPNGVYIVPLTDPRLLKDEGRPGYCTPGSRECADGSLGLAHCVGGYAAACRNQGHHILSLRVLLPGERPSFRRLSTVEINPVVNGQTELHVRQHHGQNNGTAPEEAEMAWAWFTEEVANGRIPLNYDQIRQHLGAVAGRMDDVERQCGYQWRDKDRIQKAMYPWGQYVGKRYRKMGLDEFAAQPEIMNIVNLISPQMAPRAPGR